MDDFSDLYFTEEEINGTDPALEGGISDFFNSIRHIFKNPVEMADALEKKFSKAKSFGDLAEVKGNVAANLLVYRRVLTQGLFDRFLDISASIRETTVISAMNPFKMIAQTVGSIASGREGSSRLLIASIKQLEELDRKIDKKFDELLDASAAAKR